jgi:hypothetical protein
MKMINSKLTLSALGVVAMLTSPAFAQKQHHQRSHPRTTSHSRLYDYAVPRSQPGNVDSDIPAYGNAPYDQRDDW